MDSLPVLVVLVGFVGDGLVVSVVGRVVVVVVVVVVLVLGVLLVDGGGGGGV
jgi:hypothetical protein